MAIARWVFAALAFLFGAWGILLNWHATVSGVLPRSERRHSVVPLVAGGATALACVLVPVPSINRWWWISLVVDPGCALAIACTAWHVWRRQ
jgi:hypothetical protein